LVAGGMGERLGYNGIKIELPTQTITNVSYIELYCTQILAIQMKYTENIKLPFAIMVSEDTHLKTVALLEANAHYGLDKDQVCIFISLCNFTSLLSSLLSQLSLSL
jgi:UDP-sugar pyrophosphorylase